MVEAVVKRPDVATPLEILKLLRDQELTRPEIERMAGLSRTIVRRITIEGVIQGFLTERLKPFDNASGKRPILYTLSSAWKGNHGQT